MRVHQRLRGREVYWDRWTYERHNTLLSQTEVVGCFRPLALVFHWLLRCDIDIVCVKAMLH